MIIREAHIEDAAGIAKVHIDTWRTTYAGIVPDEFLANMSYIQCDKQWISDLGGVILFEDDYGWKDISKILQD